MNADQLLAQHIERFGRGDIEGMLSEYADDVVFFTQDRVLHGPAAIRPLLEAVIAEFSQPGVSMKLLARHVEGEFAYIAWRAETPVNHYPLGSDTFVFRNDRIVMQSSAMAVAPKAS